MKSSQVNCLGEECAWWDYGCGECVMLVISRRLEPAETEEQKYRRMARNGSYYP